MTGITMTTPTPMTDAVIAAIRKWEADPRLYAHTKPPKSIKDHAVDLEIALASQIEITNNERAQKERLTLDLAAAQEENAKLKAEISRIMQAAVNGGYCRRNHAKCECENIAESIRTDE